MGFGEAERTTATGVTAGTSPSGSGGIFGPGIGAFIGAAVWRLFDPIIPSMGHSPAPYLAGATGTSGSPVIFWADLTNRAAATST